MAARKEEIYMGQNDYGRRLVKLETTVEYLNHVINRSNERFDKVDYSLERINSNVVSIDQRFENKVRDVQNHIDKRFLSIDQKAESMLDKIEISRKEAWSQLRWVLAFIIALFASPLFSSVLNFFHSIINK